MNLTCDLKHWGMVESPSSILSWLQSHSKNPKHPGDNIFLFSKQAKRKNTNYFHPTQTREGNKTKQKGNWETTGHRYILQGHKLQGQDTHTHTHTNKLFIQENIKFWFLLLRWQYEADSGTNFEHSDWTSQEWLELLHNGHPWESVIMEQKQFEESLPSLPKVPRRTNCVFINVCFIYYTNQFYIEYGLKLKWLLI